MQSIGFGLYEVSYNREVCQSNSSMCEAVKFETTTDNTDNTDITVEDGIATGLLVVLIVLPILCCCGFVALFLFLRKKFHSPEDDESPDVQIVNVHTTVVNNKNMVHQ